MRFAILGVNIVPAQIVHKLSAVAGVEVAVLACVGVVVADAIAVAAVVEDADVIVHWLAFDPAVVVVGAVALAVRCLAFDVAVGGVVAVLGNLHLLWLCCRGHIADYYS